jgi:hypothetical protein
MLLSERFHFRSWSCMNEAGTSRTFTYFFSISLAVIHRIPAGQGCWKYNQGLFQEANAARLATPRQASRYQEPIIMDHTPRSA